ncbi:MAG: DUF4388 domain-containing protein [Polyangiaceae bacterium]|nr:DUF4388 domain-containing protein [Polyangiaceae bacterium]
MTARQALNQRVADRLYSDGRISEGDYHRAVEYALRRQWRTEEALLELGILGEAELLKYIATLHQTQFVSSERLSQARLSRTVLGMVPQRLAERVGVYPLVYEREQDRLVLATADPDNAPALDEVRIAAKVRTVRALVARPAAVYAAIARGYRRDVRPFKRLLQSVSEFSEMLKMSDPYRQSSGATPLGHPGAGPPMPPPREPSPSQQASSWTDPRGSSADLGDDDWSSEEPAGSVPPPGSSGGSDGPSPFSPRPPMPYAPDPRRAPDTRAYGAPPGPPPRLSPEGIPRPAPLPRVDARPTPQAPVPPVMAPAAPGAYAPTVAATAAAEPPRRRPAPSIAPPSTYGGPLRVAAISAEAIRAITASAPFGEALRVLVSLLENDREELRGHSALVARLTYGACERAHLLEPQTSAIVVAAYLHDLGKMGTQHLTPLNVAKFDSHRTSAAKLYTMPERLMESVGLHPDTVEALGSMYEQIGGSGFPTGRRGADIPIGGRILAVADTYADLTQNPKNAYRRMLKPEQALEALRTHGGTIFDPEVVELFQKAMGGEKILRELHLDRPGVLLIDPDPEETMVLRLRLVEQGFDTHVAAGAREAREALESRDFAMIVSEVDLEEPEAGLFLREEVAKKYPETGWVFLSAVSSRTTARRAFAMDVDDFLTKPASTEIVVAKLMNLVERRQARHQNRGVAGSLSEMGMPEIVQVLGHGQRTCAIHIESGDQKGEIRMDKGHIIDAVWGDATGATAFYRMLTLGEKGRFRIDPTYVPGERRIEMSNDFLLLEGMRLLDEGAIP